MSFLPELVYKGKNTNNRMEGIKRARTNAGCGFAHCGDGRSVYVSGLPCSFENSRVRYRAILRTANGEEIRSKRFSTDYNVEVHAFVKNGKDRVDNNTCEPQSTTVCTDKNSFPLDLDDSEIKWCEI